MLLLSPELGLKHFQHIFLSTSCSLSLTHYNPSTFTSISPHKSFLFYIFLTSLCRNHSRTSLLFFASFKAPHSDEDILIKSFTLHKQVEAEYKVMMSIIKNLLIPFLHPTGASIWPQNLFQVHL